MPTPLIANGFFGSGITGHLGGNYTSIQTVTVGSGGASSIQFNSIPNTYTHLQIRTMHLMTNNAASNRIYFGTGGSIDSTTSNYSSHHLTGNGSTASAGSSSMPQFYWVTGNASSSIPEVEIIDILDYANTNKNKTMRALSGVDNNGSGEVDLTSGLWMNTSAIDTIKFDCNTGSFGQYSIFALYGVK